MFDRSTKALLLSIAAALWVLALYPVLAPRPASALQGFGRDGSTTLWVAQGAAGATDVYLLQGGNLYRFDRGLGRATGRALQNVHFGPTVQAVPGGRGEVRNSRLADTDGRAAPAVSEE